MPSLEEIKAKQQVAWSSGDYSRIAWVSVPLADVVVEAVGIRPGSKVLDVATGTGHVALAAARRFCNATGVDYVPALLEVARRRAAAEGLEVEFVEGDAENLPFEEGRFDFVLSAIGAMFAPSQQRTADELVRVTRPGGTIGMLNWTPSGFIGELFKTIGKHVSPPPELKPAALWGDEDHVRGLFDNSVSDLVVKRGTAIGRYLSPEHYADFFLTYYGPTLKAAESLDEEGRSAFRTDLIELAKRFNRASDGTVAVQSDYVTVRATRP
jgi:SAM-dependent methyltransferase